MDEDREGIVWISTMEHGLYRLSASGALRHYTSTNGLTCDPLRCAYEDREHNLWVGTSGGGLLRFKPRAFMGYDLENGLPERNIRAVIEEAPGKILIGTYGKGVVRWQGGRISLLPSLELSGSPTYVQTLLDDHLGNTWIGTFGGGLYRLAGEKLQRIPTADSGGDRTTALFEDSGGHIWIGANQTVSRFAEGEFNPYPTNPVVSVTGVRYFAENPLDRSIWAASADGLFELQDHDWKEIKNARWESFGDISCLHFDSDGTLWVGGADAGMFRFRDGNWASVGEAQGLRAHGISCLLDDGLGYWWMASSHGVIRAARRDLEAVPNGT